jgi:hypothetical protein
MYSLRRVSCDVEVLLGPDDVYILAIVNNLAEEWHILE